VYTILYKTHIFKSTETRGEYPNYRGSYMILSKHIFLGKSILKIYQYFLGHTFFEKYSLELFKLSHFSQNPCLRFSRFVIICLEMTWKNSLLKNVCYKNSSRRSKLPKIYESSTVLKK
jgi:hypothetical protein